MKSYFNKFYFICLLSNVTLNLNVNVNLNQNFCISFSHWRGVKVIFNLFAFVVIIVVAGNRNLTHFRRLKRMKHVIDKQIVHATNATLTYIVALLLGASVRGVMAFVGFWPLLSQVLAMNMHETTITNKQQ